MRAFRQAVEARDLTKVTALLADDVVFNSPASHKPFHGREQVGWILATVITIFEDFHYVDELDHEGHSMLRFRAHIADRQLEGVDLLELDDAGRIKSMTVMVRPLSGLQALADAMRVRFASRGTP